MVYTLTYTSEESLCLSQGKNKLLYFNDLKCLNFNFGIAQGAVFSKLFYARCHKGR